MSVIPSARSCKLLQLWSHKMEKLPALLTIKRVPHKGSVMSSFDVFFDPSLTSCWNSRVVCDLKRNESNITSLHSIMGARPVHRDTKILKKKWLAFHSSFISVWLQYELFRIVDILKSIRSRLVLSDLLQDSKKWILTYSKVNAGRNAIYTWMFEPNGRRFADDLCICILLNQSFSANFNRMCPYGPNLQQFTIT